MSEYQPVYIKWADASSSPTQDWKYIEDADPGLLTVHTLGFILKEDEEMICLMMTMTEAGQFSGDFVIPKSCILFRQDLNLEEV